MYHTGAAGAESLHAGFDIKRVLEGDTVDWVNVMSYDFYGLERRSEKLNFESKENKAESYVVNSFFLHENAQCSFRPWAGPTGEFTGPISPLFYAAPRNYSRKLNTHWAIEQYVCQSGTPHKIMLGVPFYGRYWNNVGGPVDGGDGMWRRVEGDVVTGGYEVRDP